MFGSETHLMNHFKECHHPRMSGVSIHPDHESSSEPRSSTHSSRHHPSPGHHHSYSARSQERDRHRTLSSSVSSVHRPSNNHGSRHRKMYSDRMTGSRDSSSEDSYQNNIVTCNFCETKLRRVNLQQHLMKKHKANLFSCKIKF